MRNRAEELKRRIWEIRECIADHPEMDLVRVYVYELVATTAELARVEGRYKGEYKRRALRSLKRRAAYAEASFRAA